LLSLNVDDGGGGGGGDDDDDVVVVVVFLQFNSDAHFHVRFGRQQRQWKLMKLI